MSAERKPAVPKYEIQLLLPPALSSMNAYYGFNGSYTRNQEVERKSILAGLMVASEYAPTNAELEANKKGEILTADINYRYKRIADAFALGIDPRYNPNSYRNNPTTLEVRNIFMAMIRPLSAEQISTGVNIILRNERRDRQFDMIAQARDKRPQPIRTRYIPDTGKYIAHAKNNTIFNRSNNAGFGETLRAA